MGILDKFLGKKIDDDDPGAAGAALAEAVSDTGSGVKATLRRLSKLGKTYYGYFTLGAELHQDYCNAVLSLWQKEGEAENVQTDLPVVGIVEWRKWPQPMMKDLRTEAEGRGEDLIYIIGPLKRRPKDALAELNALRLLTNDPLMALVILGEENLLIRREFVINASAFISPESEDLLQDLIDTAKRQQLKTGGVI